MAVKARKVHKSYPRPCCPNCGGTFKPGQLHTGEIKCPSCSVSFEAVIFQPPPEQILVRRLESSAPSTDSVAAMDSVAADGTLLSEAPAGESPCSKHPLNAAEGICERCGTFICALCRIELDGQGYCPPCFERILNSGTESFGPQVTPNDRGIARLCAIAGMLPFVGMLLGPAALYYGSKAVKHWRNGSTAGGNVGGLICILLLGLADTVSNFAGMLWMATLMYRKI